jgi:hypothetical protein
VNFCNISPHICQKENKRHKNLNFDKATHAAAKTECNLMKYRGQSQFIHTAKSHKNINDTNNWFPVFERTIQSISVHQFVSMSICPRVSIANSD